MPYLPPFDVIKRNLDIRTERGELVVKLRYDDFVDMLKKILVGIEVDEAWYKSMYQDIGAAIERGDIRSAKEHFVHDGYFEGRLPTPIAVDEPWYLKENPDVAETVRRGGLESAQAHFDESGYREGRPPFPM